MPFNRQKYLLLDSRLIHSSENLVLRVGTVKKHPANPLFGEDMPWEIRYDNLYPNTIYDEEERIFKCWYNPFIIDSATSETPPEERLSIDYTKVKNQRREMGLCYAISRDGITWQKPNLGLVEYDGSTNNNLVVRGAHGPGVIRDAHERDPTKRYKMLYAADALGARYGITVRFSEDGIRWDNAIPVENTNAARGDSHHSWLWAPDLKRYVSCSRPMGWAERRSGNQNVPLRPISRTDSEDFVHWSDAQIVLDSTEQERQYYVMPICCYADVYLGFLMIFNAVTDRVHCELTWSPDTWEWHHVDSGTPLIDTSNEFGDYDWGCAYASVPIFLSDEIRLYYGASDDTHYGWRNAYLALATMRPDGLAGLQVTASNLTGSVMTQPLLCTGRDLYLTADAGDGNVQVEVLDSSAQTLAKGYPMTGDVTDAQLRWSGHKDLSSQQGQAIRLRFTLRNSKLYAFGFHGEISGSSKCG